MAKLRVVQSEVDSALTVDKKSAEVLQLLVLVARKRIQGKIPAKKQAQYQRVDV